MRPSFLASPIKLNTEFENEREREWFNGRKGKERVEREG